MDPLSLLAGILAGATTALGVILSLLSIREKLWPKPPGAHALDAPIRDVALAIRELRSTWEG